jgi:polar amino acid transport system substrate-binding protein
MPRWTGGFITLTIFFLILPNAWAGTLDQNGTGFMFLLSMIVAAIIAGGLLIFLLRRLKRARGDLLSSERGSTQKFNILMILAGCFILLVVVLAWFALDKVKDKIQTDVGNALQIVLQTTQESLNLWVESNKFQLTRLAEDPRLVSLTERQLSVPNNKVSLFESEALMELRAFFRRNRDRAALTEFSVISPDFVNIVSMRNQHIGNKNQIASQALDLLNRAFQGETVMVPPIWSDVALSPSSEPKSRAASTMFFAAPIKNNQGAIILSPFSPSGSIPPKILAGSFSWEGSAKAGKRIPLASTANCFLKAVLLKI